MIQSMTGFGKAVSQTPNKKITVEIKSLNSKNLDLNVRLSSQYRQKEMEIRKLTAKLLERGKIDLSVYMDYTGEETSSEVNQPIVKGYIKQLKEISDGEDMELLKMAVRMPDAISSQRSEVDVSELNVLVDTIQNALNQVLSYRNQEGLALEKDFLIRIKALTSLLEEVKKWAPKRVEEVKTRLQKSLEELKIEVDQNRFEQELIYYLEKYDVTEEITRLEHHLEYFLQTMEEPHAMKGKKLAFIAQEIGREINTIGSKSNYALLQQVVVKMKDELEKLKEQLLNVL